MNAIFQIFSVVVLLGVSTCMAFKGMPTEMGIAVVAGALGFAFSNLEKFSKIKGAGFEAELKQQIEAVLEKETEPEVGSKEILSYIPEGSAKVAKAIANSKYTWRSVNGLVKETGIDIKEIGKHINWLVDRAYAEHSFGKSGSIYSLTRWGRQLDCVVD